MNIEDSPVLVLNKGWMAHSLTTVREAVNDVLTGGALFLDPETNLLYDMQGWMELETSYIAPGPDGDETILQYDVIHTATRELRLPKIIVLTDYEKPANDHDLRLNDRNLALRDGYACQYCGKRLRDSEITRDHVFPQARGGKDSWENLVIACFPCNLKKGDKTPEEAKMTLRSKPHKPKWIPLTARMGANAPKEWANYVPDFHKRPSVMV